MLSEDIQVEKMLEGLFFYIMQLELGRYPVPVGVGPYSFNVLFELLFTGKRSYFVKNNPDLYQKTRKDLNTFFKDNLEDDDKYTKRQSLYLYIWIFFVLGVSTTSFLLFDLNIFNTLVLGFIIAVPSYYLTLVLNNTTYRSILGKKYDNDIKEVVQELINYGVELIKEENLNPMNFPLKLRHDDYEGLVYEKRGKNNFVGFLRNEK